MDELDHDDPRYEEPDEYFCSTCGKKLNGRDDNWLGTDPERCKHWCNACFPEINDWFIRKKEIEKEQERLKEIEKKALKLQLKKQEKKKEFYKHQSQLPFTKRRNLQ